MLKIITVSLHMGKCFGIIFNGCFCKPLLSFWVFCVSFYEYWESKLFNFREISFEHLKPIFCAYDNFLLMSPFLSLPELYIYCIWASQVARVVNNPPANARDIREECLISGSGRSPGEGYDNLFQFSCLENLMDWGA